MYGHHYEVVGTCLHFDLESKDFVSSFRSRGCSTGTIPGKRAANHTIANRFTSDFCRSSCFVLTLYLCLVS